MNEQPENNYSSEGPFPNETIVGDRKIRLLPIGLISQEFVVEPGEQIQIAVQSVTTSGTNNAALLTLNFEDARGDSLQIENWSHHSEAVGDYAYLSAGTLTAPATDSFTVSAPERASKLKISGKQWKRGTATAVLDRIVVNIPSAGQVDAELPTGTPLPYSSNAFTSTEELPRGAKKVRLEAQFRRDEGEGRTPVRVLFRDEQGAEVLSLTDLPQNPNFGPFLQLETENREVHTMQWEVSVPPNAASIEFQGVDWGKKSATLFGPIRISVPKSSEADVDEFLSRLPAETPLVVIDTTAPPLGHETLALRPNNLAAAYERMGIAVIFLPFSTKQDQPGVVSDRLIQIDRSGFDTMLQSVARRRDPGNSYFVCSSFPSIQSVTAVQYLKNLGWTTLYEVRDDMEEFNRVGYSKWYSPNLERQMLSLADQVVSVSTALDEKLVAMNPQIGSHSVVPNAVNREVIEAGVELRTTEAAEIRNSVRRVGYVGHLTKSWFDWPLVIEAARQLPDVEFEIVGHGMPTDVVLPRNVVFLGPKTHEELPSIVRSWKAGLIPFADLPLTRSVDPNKIYEYFAWGLRCVTAPMGMVDQYPSTWVYRGVDDFVVKVEEALHSDITTDELVTLEDFLQTSSWDDRARTMLGYLGITTALSTEE